MKRQATGKTTKNKKQPAQDEKPLRERLKSNPETLLAFDFIQRCQNKNPYVVAFTDWMRDKWRPDVFVSINLPNEHEDPREWHGLERDPLFFLNLWTRAAEAIVHGPMALKIRDPYRRIGWMFRREVAQGLTHYHGIVRFPPDRRWKHEAENENFDLTDRCEHLRRALQKASTKTPQPYATHVLDRHLGADIDVRPYDAVYHAPYLLKGLWKSVPDGVTDESTWDSGLIILPHLPKTKVRRRRKVYGTPTADPRPPDRVSGHSARTHPATPSGSSR